MSTLHTYSVMYLMLNICSGHAIYVSRVAYVIYVANSNSI